MATRTLLIVLFALFLTSVSFSDSSEPSFHFVLIHGAGHGAWCWYKVTARLKQAGHRVDAIDLTSAGINNQDATTVRTLEKFVEPLESLLQLLPSGDKVVLVGHSLGGISVTHGLERFPSKVMAGVYLSALMFPSGPAATVLFNQVLAGLQGNVTFQYVNGSTTPVAASFKLDQVSQLLYNKSPREDLELAKSLLRPCPLFDPAINYTSERYETVPRYFIKTLRNDKLFQTERQEALIELTPPKRVLSIDSDHSPFFSKPDTLTSYLIKIARDERQ